MDYTLGKMELFLNLTWLFLCVALVTWWVRSVRAGKGAKAGWTALVALGILLVLLLPAISMTDDLQAMNMPAEMEHGLRHELTPVMPVSSLLLQAVPLLAVGFGLARPGLLTVRLEPLSFAAVVRAGFMRAVGTRPPTGLAV